MYTNSLPLSVLLFIVTMSVSKKSNATVKKICIACFIVISILCTISLIIFSINNAVILNPAGEIASQQRDLIVIALLLMCIVVVPVFLLVIIIPLRFKEDNKKAHYRPDWDHHRGLELVWWGVPFLVIVVLGSITWFSSHSLDPYRPLQSHKKPLNVQVVALEWKWLFLYPDQGVASINQLHIPEKTPINFTITSDAPMNSLWIPQLGGQVYAMSGMSTKLHLDADRSGIYRGSSANLSGEGFADMNFDTIASSSSDFNAWVKQTEKSSDQLDWQKYEKLKKKSVEKTPIHYQLSDKSIYNKVLMQYMSHSSSESQNTTSPYQPDEMEKMCQEMPGHCGGTH